MDTLYDLCVQHRCFLHKEKKIPALYHEKILLVPVPGGGVVLRDWLLDLC